MVRYEDILEELRKAFEELSEQCGDTPVVVEGEKDMRALRALGIDGEIVMVNAGVSIFNLCEQLSRKHKEVIVLTDWDSRGGTLCRRIREGLEANGSRPNLDFRQRIAVLCRKDIKDVEGLPNYFRTLERWTKEQGMEGAHRRSDESLRRARNARRRRD